MKLSDVIILALLVIALGLGIYALIPFLDQTPVDYVQVNESVKPDSLENITMYSEIVQFYPRMRFVDRMISYSLDESCTQSKRDDLTEAFEIISERTILDFYESNFNPGISVLCSEITPKAEEKGHFVAGEGGPSEVINTTNFAVIYTGRISLYRDETCDTPNVAIHEILHTLGFDHYDNKRSILYPVTSCNQEIDDEVIRIVNDLYSIDSLADLEITDVGAYRKGRYLNFEINVTNIGLVPSVDTSLRVYQGDERVDTFDLGEIDVGTKKLLSVENLRVQYSSSDIIFEVVNNGDELTLVNNKVTLSSS